jgi:cardiolipin synthase
LVVPFTLKKDFGLAIVIFAIAAISDFLDGYIARKFKIVSKIGAMLDPLADKVLITASYALLAWINLIPLYVAAIVIARDVIILFVILVNRIFKVNLEIHPLMSSKINTTFQLIFVLLVLSCNYLATSVPSLMKICEIIVCISTIFSGAEYAYKYYQIKIFKR